MQTTEQVATIKERGISFSPLMLAAIRDGRKTQTRRHIPTGWWRCLDSSDANDRAKALTMCPFQIGQTLWVKEAVVRDSDGWIRYACDNALVPSKAGAKRTRWTWKPSKLAAMYCPRWASRTPLVVTGRRIERVQQISEADALAEGFDQRTCATVLRTAKGWRDSVAMCWLENDKGDWCDGTNYCRQCAERIRRKHKRDNLSIRGGIYMAHESDGPAYCEECYRPLLMSLTKYGVERELRLEDDPHGKEPQYFPCTGLDASISHMIADGFGDLRDEHKGRLAQIGFATLWEQLNGKKCPWESNPDVWVIEFQQLPA